MAGLPAARFDPNARLADLGKLSAFAWRRFQTDRCLRVAASLSYTTLLAIVPLMTIGFAMFSAFPAFDRLQERVRGLIFENMVPELGAVIQEQLVSFVENTGGLTAIGILVLAVTALMMFATVEAAFNAIWRVGESRSWIGRLLIFWAILTVGPLLMGASLTLSTYMFTLTRMLEIEAFTGPAGTLLRLLPFVLEVTVFALLYLVVPNKKVHWPHALIGGLIAALLFELLKKGFALYIANFPAQQTIYGALSTIPLFLVWMYVSWAAVLVGAEIAASLPEYRHQTPASTGARRRLRLSIALAVLARLAEAARRGEGGRREEEFASEIAEEEPLFRDVIALLQTANYIALTGEDEWVLCRDLDAVRLVDLYRDLGLAVAADPPEDGPKEPWQGRLTTIISALEQSQTDIMGGSLKALLATREPAELEPLEQPSDAFAQRGSAAGR